MQWSFGVLIMNVLVIGMTGIMGLIYILIKQLSLKRIKTKLYILR